MNTMLARLNHADVPLGHAKEFGCVSAGCTACEQRPDSGNVVVGKPGFWIALANKMPLSIKSVLRVFFMASGDEVRWINASRVITSMAKYFSVRDWTNLKRVSDSVRSFGFAVNPNRPIAASPLEQGTSPEPTRFCFFNLRVKPLSQVFAEPSSCKFDVAILGASFTFTSMRWRGVVKISANFANAVSAFLLHGARPFQLV